jgi:hypothetical protein
VYRVGVCRLGLWGSMREGGSTAELLLECSGDLTQDSLCNAHVPYQQGQPVLAQQP